MKVKMKKIKTEKTEKTENCKEASKEVKISAIQLQAINSILTEKSIDVAFRKIGITRQTFYNWLRNENFKSAYESAKRQLENAALDKLQAHLERAVDAYGDLLSSKNESVRRQAAEGVINFVLKIREGKEFEGRLENLEKFILIEIKYIEITRCYDE